MKVEAPKRIENGKHVGVITDVVDRTQPYQYTDIVITLNDVEGRVKAGLPTYLTPESKLGLFLKKAGVTVDVGLDIDLKAVLVNRKVELMTVNEKKGDKTFTNVVIESIVFLPE